jgi:hypothetical protein
VTSPVLDSNVNSLQTKQAAFTNTTALPGLSTTQSPDTVIVIVSYGNTSGSPTVSSITSSHLTFSKRGAVTNPTSGAHGATIELWAASASSTLSAEVITVNWSSNIDAASVVAQAVTGLFSTTNPYDNHAGLPASAFNTTSVTPPVVTFSTAQSDDLLWYFALSTNGNAQGGFTPSGWTSLVAVNNPSGINYAYLGVWYQSVSVPQSGATVVNTEPSGDVSYTGLVDALTADSNPVSASPFFQADWPNPRGHQPRVQTQPLGTLTPGYATVTFPFTFEWGEGGVIPWRVQTQQMGSAATLFAPPAPKPPIRQNDWPNPVLRVQYRTQTQQLGFQSYFTVPGLSVTLVAATAAAGVGSFVTQGNSAVVLAIYSIMRNKPVPSQGQMVNTIIALQGAFY